MAQNTQAGPVQVDDPEDDAPSEQEHEQEQEQPEVREQGDDEARAERAPRARRRLLRRLFAGAGTGVWFGLLLTAGGFGLIAYTWARTAALLDVAQQVPYLVSGGLVGLGLILVGLLVVNLSAKRREALDRRRQLEEVRDALVNLRASIEGDERDEP